MTDSRDKPNRIAAEELGDYRSWQVPLFADRGQTLPSAEREAKGRRASDVQRSKEKIEEVDMAASRRGGITAEELEELVGAAEQDGFAKGRREGFDKGRAEGYEAGREEGERQMREQLQEQHQRLAQLATGLLDPLAEQDEDLERLLVDTVCALTRSLVKRELLEDSSTILEVVHEALDALPVGARNLTIHLNPDDLALVEDYAAEQHRDWQFSADEKLTPGGCRIEARESRVDFSVEQRLEHLLTQFVDKQLAGQGTAEADDEPPREAE